MARFVSVAIAVLVLAFGALSCSGPEPTEPPYYVPLHPDLEFTPLGLSEGVLEARGKCLYLGTYLMIWPDDYYVVERDGVAVIEGGGWRIAPGDHIEVVGGAYERASDLPNAADVATRTPCPGPYRWVSGVQNVTPRD